MTGVVFVGVKTPPQRDSWLGFDLREVMAAVGPHDGLTWRLRDAALACDDLCAPEKWQAVAYDSHLDEGATLTWDDMAELAKACPRVLEGTFTGFRDNKPILQFTAVGNRYWVVWSKGLAPLEGIRFAFNGVEDYDERTPHI